MPTTTHLEIITSSEDTTAIATDCDCACAAPLLPAADLACASTTRLQCHPQQQHIALSDEHTVLFVPSRSRVVVVNAAVVALLQRFQTPHSLADLDAQERTAAQQLYAAGLLCTADSLTLPPPPPPDELAAWLHVTNACNLRCTYCYIDKTEEAMGTDTALASVDAVLRSAQRNGYRKVALKYAGGEASLALPMVETMHHYAREQAQQMGLLLRGVVLSNGVGLTRHKLRLLRGLGLSLMISLDGPRETHDHQRPRIGGQGSFDAACASIERARKEGLHLTVSITVTGTSAASLPDIVAWLLEHEVHFTLNFYRECDASATLTDLRLDEERIIAGMRAAYQIIAQHPPRYSLLGSLLDRTNLSAPHQRSCAAGENYLVIDQRGQVAACQMEIAHPITTIHADNPLEIIRLATSGVQHMPVDEKEGCRACQWKYWCAGGCAVATFRATGRSDVQSPNCAIYKSLYPDVLRLEGLRLLHWHHHSDHARQP